MHYRTMIFAFAKGTFCKIKISEGVSFISAVVLPVLERGNKEFRAGIP